VAYLIIDNKKLVVNFHYSQPPPIYMISVIVSIIAHVTKDCISERLMLVSGRELCMAAWCMRPYWESSKPSGFV